MFFICQFEFQATRGFLPRSDIAVDDISLTPGSCENITSGEKNTSKLVLHLVQEHFSILVTLARFIV